MQEDIVFDWLKKHEYEAWLLYTADLSDFDIINIKDIRDGSYKLLKIVDVSDLDEKVVEEAVAEMKRVNSMDIDGLVKYEVIETDGKNLYRVMKSLPEYSLAKMNPLLSKESDSFDILDGILKVLKKLDENGLFHSDLKPSNIFLNDENEVILSDYLNNLLYKGRCSEELCFVSIDELMGKELDISSDIWNFGLIFYYMMSGKYAFIGKSESEIFEKIKEVKYEKLNCECEEEMTIFLEKILIKEKKNRLKIDELIKEFTSIYIIQ